MKKTIIGIILPTVIMASFSMCSLAKDNGKLRAATFDSLAKKEFIHKDGLLRSFTFRFKDDFDENGPVLIVYDKYYDDDINTLLNASISRIQYYKENGIYFGKLTLGNNIRTFYGEERGGGVRSSTISMFAYEFDVKIGRDEEADAQEVTKHDEEEHEIEFRKGDEMTFEIGYSTKLKKNVMVLTFEDGSKYTLAEDDYEG